MELDKWVDADFWKYVNKTPTCWLWTGYTNNDGYAQYGRLSAYRYIYARMVGDLISGLEIDHLCRVKSCVNPEHLEQVTHAENIQRSVPYRKSIVKKADRTHCLQGHEYTNENTLNIAFSGRTCRTCYEYVMNKKVERIAL